MIVCQKESSSYVNVILETADCNAFSKPVFSVNFSEQQGKRIFSEILALDINVGSKHNKYHAISQVERISPL